MRRLAQLLDEPEHLVSKQVGLLEAKNGYPSHDARLLAESIQKIRVKTTELGLDPDDTTGAELYHALLARYDRDSQEFDHYYGTYRLNSDQKSAKAVQLVSSMFDLPQQWAVKNRAAKNLLRKLPPKHLMKQLHYRSVDSLLKREDTCQVLLAAKYIESGVWQRTFAKLVSAMDQTEIEMRPVQLIKFDFTNFSKDRGPANHIAYDTNSASLGLWPSEQLNKAPLLSMVLLMLEELNQFGQFNRQNQITKAGEMLNWWADMDHLIAELSSESVSMSLKDCAANALAGNDFHERSLDHARMGFWRELLSKYENLPELDGLFDHTAINKVMGLKPNVPDLAYEFAEDF